MNTVGIQSIRRKILEELYKGRSDFYVNTEQLKAALPRLSEKELHTELKYLEGKCYITIPSKFCGKEYLNFTGVSITSRGIDVYENNDDKYIWPTITITNNNIKSESSNISIDSQGVEQKANVKK